MVAISATYIWTLVIEDMSKEAQMAFLRGVNRTRKRNIPFWMNGRIQLVPRAAVRDHLKLLLAYKH